ncbi:hypothetical protein PRIPAC_73078 [Pristionchus pacificus]|uniref:BTB domain-containing protein n=1 Tax=Pristionchus pacificus TaxID=54126 RepID=A0A2A6D0F4_PRIPA|nr:hypothetical protein PRIPAC_73078 [Pristionchus pacificus]|eukprot:PDM83858.1 BTB domain-containing protein [Pristionchus pacificus]
MLLTIVFTCDLDSRRMSNDKVAQNNMVSPSSSISLMSSGDEEVARLRDQIRLLSTEMTTLRRDYNGLKERMEADKLSFSEHLFSLTLPTVTLADTPYLNEPVELNGVNVILYGAVITNSEGVQQLAFWCGMRSSSSFDATLISKCAIVGYSNAAYNTGPFTEIIRLKEESSVMSRRHIAGVWNNIKANLTNINVKFTIKLVRPFNPSTISFDDGDNYVTITLGDETLQVNTPYVSEWSNFLRAYFSSDMKERAAGVYPIEDCPITDFREMLDVIYPTSKPIDIWNVEKMLELADRFIMPMLTRKCEVFLNDGYKHNFTEIQLLIMADKYNLFLTRTNVLEKLISTTLLRSKIIKTEGYGTLSYEMKRAVDARYVELDVQEKP